MQIDSLFFYFSDNRIMKKFLFAIMVSSLVFFQAAFAKDTSAEKPKDTYEYETVINEIKGVSKPYLSGDYLVFTAKNDARTVGIAFDFENYNKIHYFHLHKTRDFEGTVTDSWFFYVIERPKKINEFSYRLIIDGLWTTDPVNSERYFSNEEGVYLSYMKIPYATPPATETLDNGYTRFVCISEPGQKIRIGGTFSNWDSWIYEMKEILPGQYEIELPLPDGTYYYAYYTGIKSFIDTTNPLKGYSKDGKIVSCINVTNKAY